FWLSRCLAEVFSGRHLKFLSEVLWTPVAVWDCPSEASREPSVASAQLGVRGRSHPCSISRTFP
ncbi:hypothetical protein ILYODFUR_017378, partial [Ilyodon furcidens]